jgi:hypothetical protein
MTDRMVIQGLGLNGTEQNAFQPAPLTRCQPDPLFRPKDKALSKERRELNARQGVFPTG